MDKALNEIRDLEREIASGAAFEDRLRRYIKREGNPVHRQEVQEYLERVGAQLDRLEEKVVDLRIARIARLDSERRELKSMRPGRRSVNYLDTSNIKEAA